MDLTLRVTRYQNLPPPQQMQFTIGTGGGKIGRNAENDVVLPDPERWVSGFHAEIRFRNGRYYLVDTSSNGTFVGGSPNRMPQGQEVELNDGDEVLVGAYELQVSITAADLERTDVLDRPLASHDQFDPFDQQRPDADRIDDALEGVTTPDILDLVPNGGKTPESVPPVPDAVGQRPADPGLMQDGDDPLHDAGLPELEPEGYGPGDQVAAGHADHAPQENAYFHTPEVIPEDFDLLSPESGGGDLPERTGDIDLLSPGSGADQPPEQPEQRAPSPPRSSEALADTEDRPQKAALPPHQEKPAEPILEPKSPSIAAKSETMVPEDPVVAFLAGLGYSTSALSAQDAPEVMHAAGELLRTLTEGLMAVMMSRASFKSELRIEMTTIRAAENNPFKFSVGVDDALSNLLFRHTKGYLPPVQAAQEAVDDIQAHQMAMLAGLRAALQAFLARFDPVELERKVRTESMMDNLLPKMKQAKCWDRFTEVYTEVSADTADDFMNLFGPIFCNAYEEQVARLKQGRRDGRR